MTTTDRPPQDFWLKHIKRWQASNLSQAEYCQQQKLIITRFGYWKRKFVPLDELPSKSSSPGFARVNVVSTASQNSGLSLHFSNGLRLQGISSDNLTVVSQLLEILK